MTLTLKCKCLLFKPRTQPVVPVRVNLQINGDNCNFLFCGDRNLIAEHFKDLMKCTAIDSYQTDPVYADKFKNQVLHQFTINFKNEKALSDMFWYLRTHDFDVTAITNPYKDHVRYASIAEALTQSKREDYCPLRLQPKLTC